MPAEDPGTDRLPDVGGAVTGRGCAGGVGGGYASSGERAAGRADAAARRMAAASLFACASFARASRAPSDADRLLLPPPPPRAGPPLPLRELAGAPPGLGGGRRLLPAMASAAGVPPLRLPEKTGAFLNGTGGEIDPKVEFEHMLMFERAEAERASVRARADEPPRRLLRLRVLSPESVAHRVALVVLRTGTATGR